MFDRTTLEREAFEKMAMFKPPIDGMPAGAISAEANDPSSTIFWGEISPCEHMVQIYQDTEVFLDALEGFVAGGLAPPPGSAGDGVIVIATPDHLAVLEQRLLKRGVDVAAAAACDQYIALDAEETLSKFMVGGWVDRDLFSRLVSSLVTRAGRGGTGARRRVRAFGEMVAVLWQRGNKGATIRLEYLWHDFCKKNAFCLFCAYPRACFTQDAETSIKQICAAHSRVVAG